MIGGKEVRERLKECRIEDRIDSDHHPVIVKVRGREGRILMMGGKKMRGRGSWDVEGREVVRNRIRVVLGEGEINEEWEKVELSIGEALEAIKEGGKGDGNKEWWERNAGTQKGR